MRYTTLKRIIGSLLLLTQTCSTTLTSPLTSVASPAQGNGFYYEEAHSRVIRSTTCVGIVVEEVGTENFTDTTDVCSGGTLLFTYWDESFETVVENYTITSCQNVTTIEEQNITTLVNVTEDVIVTRTREITICTQNQSVYCDPIELERFVCGQTSCGFLGSETCDVYCWRPRFCIACTAQQTVIEEYNETVSTTVERNISTLQNISVTNEICRNHTRQRSYQRAVRYPRPDNCVRAVTEHRIVSQLCEHGSCDGTLCECDDGWSGDDCATDVNECQNENGGCATTCIDQDGSYQCECDSGFELGADNRHCNDIDECSAVPPPCSADDGSNQFNCVNHIPGFACMCSSGYTLDSANTTCIAHDCGALSPPNYCPNSATPALGTNCTLPSITCSEGTTTGKSCRFSCPHDAYVLEGPFTGTENIQNNPNRVFSVSCEVSGAWSNYSRSWCRYSNLAPTNIIMRGGEFPENSIGFVAASFSAVDPDTDDHHTFSLISGDGVYLRDNNLIVSRAFNYEIVPEFNVTIRVSDKGNERFTKTFTIRVSNINEPPTGVSISSGPGIIPENATAGYAIGVLAAEDQDSADYHFFVVLSPRSFAVIQGELIFQGQESDIDFEVLNEVAITVRCADTGQGNLAADLVLRISVGDSNDAPQLAVEQFTVSESSTVGSLIGTILVSDEDLIDDTTKPWTQNRPVQSYTLGIHPVTNYENDAFADWVDSNPPISTQGMNLLLAGQLDFENQPGYVVNLSITDSGSPPKTSYHAFIVLVSNDAEAPLHIELDQTVVNETVSGSSTSVGAVVGNLTVIDEDIADSITVDIVTGTDYFSVGQRSCSSVLGSEIPGGQFSSSRQWLRCQFPIVIVQTLLYSSATSRTIRVLVNDNSGATLSTFSISILNVNEPPSSVVLPSTEVYENSLVGVLVCELGAIDNDSFDVFAYSISGSLTSTPVPFTIRGSELVVTRPELLDYESRTLVSFQILVTDSGSPNLQSLFNVTVNITDVNERITTVVLSNTTFPESAQPGDLISSLTVIDPDNIEYDVQNHSCNITGGGNTFYIDEQLNIRLRSASIDFEREQAYENLLLQCIDTGQPPLVYSQSISLHVENLNERPNGITLSSATVLENSIVGTLVGFLTTNDPDSTGTNDNVQSQFVYSLVDDSGTEFSQNDPRCPFEIVHYNTLQTTLVLNFEQTASYSIWVKAVDPGNLSLTEQFIILVGDVNDIPDSILPTQATVLEGLMGAHVTDLAVTDEDVGQSHSLELINTNLNNGDLFELRNKSLHLATNFEADFESGTELFIEVVAIDNGFPFQRQFVQSIRVAISNVNERPVDIYFDGELTDPYTMDVYENVSTGSIFGLLVVEDPDNNWGFGLGGGVTLQTHTCNVLPGTLAYSMISATNNTSLVLRSGLFNYESTNLFNLSIRCIDNGIPPKALVSQLQVRILDVNEPPTELFLDQQLISSSIPLVLDENLLVGTVLGNLTVTDPDNCNESQCNAFQTHSITLDSDYLIVRDNQLVVTRPLNFELILQFPISLRFNVSDSGVPSLTSEFLCFIEVVDQNDRPTLSFTGSRLIYENATRGTLIGLLSVSDTDRNSSAGLPQEHVFAVNRNIRSNGADYFSVEGNQLKFQPQSSEWTLRPGVVLYVALSVTDNGSPPLQGGLEIGITVMDVNEPPNAISLPSQLFVPENISADVVVANFTVSDPDNQDCSPPCILQSHSCVIRIMDCFPSSVINCTSAEAPMSVGNMSLLSRRGALNYEAITSYTLAVTCVDSGMPPQSITETTTLVILDSNDAPSSIRIVSPQLPPHVPEDAQSGVFVGHLVAEDEDRAQNHIFEFTDSANSVLLPFIIDGSEIMVSNSDFAIIDFEQQSSYTFEVTAYDNGIPPANTTKNVTIAIDDVNEPPFAISVQCGCRESPCQHGGSCISNTQDEISFTCGCAFGYSGNVCEVNANGESIAIASGASNCLNIPRIATSTDPLFRVLVADVDTNQFHQISLSESSTTFEVRDRDLYLINPLFENSTLNSDDLRLVLRATDPGGLFTERVIQLALSACATTNCSSNAICEEQGNSFRCRCRQGFSGDGVTCVANLCDGVPCVLNSCLTQPCDNGAICRDSFDVERGEFSVECDCQIGYTGAYCTDRIEAQCTTNSPCMSGTCIEMTNTSSLRCECPLDVFGQFCQYDFRRCVGNSCPDNHQCAPTVPGSNHVAQCVNDASIISLSYRLDTCVNVSRFVVSGCEELWESQMEEYGRFVNVAFATFAEIVFSPLGFIQLDSGSETIVVQFVVFYAENMTVVSQDIVMERLNFECRSASVQLQGLCNILPLQPTYAPPVTLPSSTGISTAAIFATVSSALDDTSSASLTSASTAVGVVFFLLFLLFGIALLVRRRNRKRDRVSMAPAPSTGVKKRAPVAFMNPAYAAQSQDVSDVLYPNRIDAGKRSTRAFGTIKNPDVKSNPSQEDDHGYLDLEQEDEDLDGYLTVVADGGSVRGTIRRSKSGTKFKDGENIVEGQLASVTIDNPLFRPNPNREQVPKAFSSVFKPPGSIE